MMKKKRGIQVIHLGALVLAFLAALQNCSAQVAKSATPHVADFAVTFTADRTNPVGGSNHWLLGGSAEVGANIWKGFGPVAKVTGVTTSALSSQNVPLNLVVAVFGPRYRFQPKHLPKSASVYGEGLVGVANGIRGLFPATSGSTVNATALALQVGGGVDFELNSRFAVRALEASWMRTQFANATTNVQNHFVLGSGVVVRF